MKNFKLISFNLGKTHTLIPNNKKKYIIKEFIELTSPDIVCLQGSNEKYNKTFKCLEDYTLCLNDNSKCSTPILVKKVIPIKNSCARFLDESKKANCNMASLKLDGYSIHIFNTKFYQYGDKIKEFKSLMNLLELNSFYGPQIVTGSFATDINNVLLAFARESNLKNVTLKTGSSFVKKSVGPCLNHTFLSSELENLSTEKLLPSKNGLIPSPYFPVATSFTYQKKREVYKKQI